MHASTGTPATNLSSTTTTPLDDTPQTNDKYRKISLKDFPLFTSINFKLNINHVDKLALKTYRELILDKEANQKPYLLALVVGKFFPEDPTSFFPYLFFDAIKLNQSLENEESHYDLTAIFYFSLAPHTKKFVCLASETLKENNVFIRNQDMQFKIAKNDEETPEGKWNLAQCYEKGIGTQKDMVKAFELYKISADLNNTRAQFKIAVVYAKGIGVPRDQKMALKYYQELSLKECASAQYVLGKMYLKGKVVEKNSETAAHLFKKAIHNQCSPALHQLATLYLTGDGVPKNPEKAIDLYLRDEKNAASLFALGQIYAEGTVIKKDINKAKQYFAEAQKKGHLKAGAALDELPVFTMFK